ncbi:MAG: hypothetical protein ACXW2Y_08830, partial [Acidimicrobiia bacterium]
MTATDLPEPAPATRRERRPARRNTRKIGIVVAMLVGLLLVPMLAAGAWVYFQLHPRGALGERVVVTVQPGWGTSQIGDELARVGVIGSGLVFRL